MFDFANLGNYSDALKMTGSNYDPASSGLPAQGQTAAPDINQALEATGSEFRTPDWVDSAKQATDTVDALPETGSVDPVTGEKDHPGLKNSNLANLAKKAVGAVAAFYTGGLSSAAMNVGGQVLAKNNPKAAGAASMAGGLF